MPFFRAAILLALLASGALFVLYAVTSDARYKRYGLITLGWTLLAAFGFFAVLIVDRLS